MNTKAWMRHEPDQSVPIGGYRVLVDTCPARPGSDRAARWPLLVEFADRPGGVDLLDAALKAGGFKVESARGMLGWCAGAGFVAIGPTTNQPRTADRSRQRLPASDLRRVTAEHVWNALDKLRDPAFQHSYGASIDFDAVTARGERFPPKAVFGLAASEALGFQVLPGHFSSGRGHPAFDVLESVGLAILGKDEQQPAADHPYDGEDRDWSEGRPKLIAHLRRERAAGLAKAKKAQFERLNGKLFCEHCLVDPIEAYGGPEGAACIEVHHASVHVADMVDNHRTRLEDLLCLCANCPRVAHRRLKTALE